jgi:hypothetical protein
MAVTILQLEAYDQHTVCVLPERHHGRTIYLNDR